MKNYFNIFLLLMACATGYAQPVNDNPSGAIAINNVFSYCSADSQFTSNGATPSGYAAPVSWPGAGNDVWFTFIAERSYVQITVTGRVSGNSNTLNAPLVALYTYEPATRQAGEVANGSTRSANNIAEVYNGGLSFGSRYYIRVSADGTNTGSFRLCLNNYTPIIKPGQDCSTATVLCSKEAVSTTDISGRGAVAEAGQTCILGEVSSAWYTFTAATAGTLTFTITPNNEFDDLDWALFRLGPGQSCSNINQLPALRCAAGQGKTGNCIDTYFQTGLSMTATDISEAAGCSSQDGSPRDGFVSYINMNPGDVYYLIVNNVTSGTGFKLEFGGTGQFVGPSAQIDLVRNQPCVSGLQSFTFSTPPNPSNASVRWTFGDAADVSLVNSTSPGPVTVTYNTIGTKRAFLQAISNTGCEVVSSLTFDVGITPLTPVIVASQDPICTGDTLVLSATSLPDATYNWTGPNNFTGTGQSIRIPVRTTAIAGNYRVTITQYGCVSPPGSLTIHSVIQNPVASFTSDPVLPNKLGIPVTVRFSNRSQNSDSWLWDFGDGSTSTEENPEHTYTIKGNYIVKLTATNQNTCNSSTQRGTFVIRDFNTIFIPNTFTPNGDGVNDELEVTIINVSNYRFKIFNRWGQPLFETISLFENWNGKHHGKDVPVGTYYYLLTATDNARKPIRVSGSVTVVR